MGVRGKQKWGHGGEKAESQQEEEMKDRWKKGGREKAGKDGGR